jgi:ABC-2 type transport system ATP-binding protein
MSQRLGIAAAVLGDPTVVLFDEPINGLDPEGIQWIRGLLRRFAAEGRTVFISSHLMSEMQLTADHLIVVGRGRVIADAGIAELIAASSGSYLSVRSPQSEQLAGLLRAQQAEVTVGDSGALQVRGTTPEVVGDMAAAHRLTLYELAVHDASLEAAFFELTDNDSEYRASTMGPADVKQATR